MHRQNHIKFVTSTVLAARVTKLRLVLVGTVGSTAGVERNMKQHNTAGQTVCRVYLCANTSVLANKAHCKHTVLLYLANIFAGS